MSKRYFISVSLMTFIIPFVGFYLAHLSKNETLTFGLFVKWFIFSAVGLRLLVAGLQQSINPAFTAKEIFHLANADSYPVIRELGFANICFGSVGIISFFKPEWRMASAFASGLYYAFAALLHIIKKPAGVNETFALWTDLIIFSVLALYFCEAI